MSNLNGRHNADILACASQHEPKYDDRSLIHFAILQYWRPFWNLRADIGNSCLGAVNRHANPNVKTKNKFHSYVTYVYLD